MPNKVKLENFYRTIITSSSAIPLSGDFSFDVAVAPKNKNGFLIIGSENISTRQIFYYHDVIGNTIYVKGANRITKAAIDLPNGYSVKMNDVAEIFNYFGDNISTLFYLEKMGGLIVKAWGGYLMYNNNQVGVSDTTFTLVDNTTNYIKYDAPTNTIFSDTTAAGNIKCEVTCSSGEVTTINYRISKESYLDFSISIEGAIPSQAGNAGKVLITNGSTVSWGVLNEKRTGLSPGKVLITDSSGNETESTTLPDAVMSSIATSPIIMNNVGNAGKYIQTVALGEAVSSATPVAMVVVSATSSINVIPLLSSNSGNSDYIVSASSEYIAGFEAYRAFDGNDSDGWAVGNYITGPSWIKVQMTKKEVFKNVKLSGRSGTLTLNSGWKVQGSNDGFTSEVVDLYTGSSNVPGTVTEYAFMNNTGYFGYRIYASSHPVSGGLATLQFTKLSTGSMEFSNTLGSNIAGSRVKSGIVIRPKVTDALGRVYTSQNATSSSARVQLYQGATLVAEKTPTISTDYVDFTESVTKDTDYIICINDSSYFNAQNNELALSSYQANNPYCVSGYLNGDTNVNPQNIRRIDFGTKKAMKATANSTAEYANFAGFISGTKAIGDVVELNSNDLTLVSGFSLLSSGSRYYVGNPVGTISTGAGNISRVVGLAVSSSQIIIGNPYYPGTTITRP